MQSSSVSTIPHKKARGVDLSACHACDLLLETPRPKPGYTARCPRCGTVIVSPRADTLNRSLALALTGLLLYWPAVSLPTLEMSVLTSSNSATVFQAFTRLWQSELYGVALLVLVCSILAPLAKILSLLAVLAVLKLGWRWHGTASIFRLHNQVDTWGMLEVYMIALLVSVIKLMDLADIHVGVGLFCFAGLMIVSFLLALNLDRDQIWKQIERAQTPPSP